MSSRAFSSLMYSQIEVPRLRVEPDRGLVQEQHPGRVQQAAGDLQPALHAAGERLTRLSRRSHRPTISMTCCIRGATAAVGTPYSSAWKRRFCAR